METKKSILEILITPTIIGIVGVLGTYFVTNQQIKSSEQLGQAQIISAEKTAKSDQQIKIIEIFNEKITSEDIKEREIAVRILGALDYELAEKMMTAVAQSSSTDSTTRNIANQMKKNIQKRNSYVVIGSYDKLDVAIKNLHDLEYKVNKYPMRIYQNKKGLYAVCLIGIMSYENALNIIKFAKANIKKDAYIKTSEQWLEIDY